MAYVITDGCIKDRKCVEVCPVNCIDGAEDSPHLYIDPDACIDCAACEPVCPAGSIYFVDDVPDGLRHAIAANADFFARLAASG
jgi:NAD-dependent dihydropyrimidine dehydrogenase PreA subunit